jgi:hypothetical protein
MSQPIVNNVTGAPAQHELLDESPEDKKILQHRHFEHDEANPSRTLSCAPLLLF